MSPISSKTAVAKCDLGPISSNRKVVDGVFYRFWLPNNTGQFQAKWRLRRVFWRIFWATGQLRTVFNQRHQFWLTGQLRMQFLTGFSFLTIRANLKQNDSCAVWLGQILSNSRVAHSVLVKFKLCIKYRLFQGKRQLCRAFWRKFWATGQLRNVAHFKQNDSCAMWFGANLEEHGSSAQRFSQALASQQYGLIWSKTTVAQSVLTPISSSRTIAHGVLEKF